MRSRAIDRLADEDLMHLVKEGRHEAFELVYDRHGTAAFSLAYRILGDRTAAEDATQEAFISIWRSRDRYASARGSVRTWILSIVHRRAIDALRRTAARPRTGTQVEDVEERTEAPGRTDVEAVRRDEARTVRAAIGALPEEQSRVIQLAYFGGFTHTEIAEMLGAPVGTVKGRMRLGLQKMREQLEGVA
jgi:RNA polymerase sigma-70 factor (ECF subfamily)